ncbi:MAG TPA: substrate-binding domain-containing protein [Actinomycetota bacterium]
MRRALLALLLVLPLLANGTARALDPFCYKQLPPDSVSGQGTRAQLGFHYKLWLPSYGARCGAAKGTIAYYGTSDAIATEAAIDRVDMFYGREVALSRVEQALIETDSRAQLFRIGSVQHIPVYIDALTVSYNLDCAKQPLKISGENLALMYAGLITSWNDEALVADNPSLAACERAVRLVVRSDQGGASLVFKDYLAKRNPMFRPYVEPQLNQAWPLGASPVCKGNADEGMAGCISSRQGAIGYVSLRVAKDRGLKQALIDNGSGAYAAATSNGCKQAADSSTLPPQTTGDWSGASLTNPPSGYALCSFGFVLAWQNYRGPYPTTANPEQVRNIRDYLIVVLSDPVQAKLVNFAVSPLPPRVLSLARAGVNSIELS